MKTIRLLLFLAFWLSFTRVYGQSNEMLSKQLDSLYKADFFWRELYRQVESGQKDTLSKDYIARKSRETDSINYIAVQAVFSQFGYPNYDMVGDSSEHHFWLLVQHADKHPEFQQKVLDAMKEQVDKDNASARDYAYLVDKIATDANKPQVYGTQVSFNKDKQTYEPKPVLDPDKLDERRKEVGLSTMAKYIERLNDHYHGIKPPPEDEDSDTTGTKN